MPEMINYVITETRSVVVVANSPADAVQIGEAAFRQAEVLYAVGARPEIAVQGIWGHTRGAVRVTTIEAKEI